MESPQAQVGPSHDGAGPAVSKVEQCFQLEANNSEATRRFYDEWAHEYDKDCLQPEVGYVGPMNLAKTLRDHTNIHGDIIDIGCGTGLGGVALAQLGAKVIDGVDISSGMLREARSTGVYRDLIQGNLEEQLPLPANSYDTVFCVGAIGTGHIGPEAIPEFVRLAKPEGWIVLNVYGSPSEQVPYDDEIERFVKQGVLQITFSDETRETEGLGTVTKDYVFRMAK